MNSYRITGIVKAQKYLFENFLAGRNARHRQELAVYFDRYLGEMQQQLRITGVAVDSLNPNSRAALFNIEGLTHLLLNRPHRYADLYRRAEEERRVFRKLQRSALILEFTSAARLSHRITLNRHMIRLKIAHSALELDDEYFSCLFRILFSKACGKQVPAETRARLLAFEQDYRLPEKSRQSHSGSREQGNSYNLQAMFSQLNTAYFGGRLAAARLQWSRGLNRRRLGSCDNARNRITLSRALDHPDVPEFVVRSILYHEMLHLEFPPQQHNGRRVIHSPAFKKAERQFDRYAEAGDWLKNDWPAYLRKRKI